MEKEDGYKQIHVGGGEGRKGEEGSEEDERSRSQHGNNIKSAPWFVFTLMVIYE